MNRVDDIIVFNKLSQDEIKQIAGMMLNTLVGCLEKLNIKISFVDEAVTAIADEGFDENYGARPLRRAEDPLSEEMLAGRVQENSNVVCDYKDDGFVFLNSEK